MLALGVPMSLRFGAVVLLMVLFVSNVASAQVSFISQDRSIYYHGSGTCYFLGIPTPFENENGSSAPDFGPFETQLGAGWIDVSQSSRLGALNISASGAVDVDAEHTGFPPENYCIGQADGHSTFQVEFSLLEPSQYQISARIDVGTTWGGAASWVRLEGPEGVSVFDVSDYSLPGGECEFDGAYSSNCAEGETSGVLQPGHYVLEAHAGGGAATWPSNPSLWEGYADATYTVTLALPRGVPALSGRSAGLLGLVLLALGVLAPSQIRTRKRGRW